jgi:cytochrome c-type biogenesis protein CcmF
MSINYIGEHLLPGQIGQAFIWTSFLASLMATVLFFLRSREGREQNKLLRTGSRSLYVLHVAGVLGAAAVLYYVIFRHYFEYAYVWQYSSRSLRTEYIISCFWAGQEGSFMIWAIWQAVIGLFLLKLSKKWEPQVMAVFSLSQIFLTSMMLGVHLGGIQLGAGPFQLLRERYMSVQGSIFSGPDYLSMIPDGNGLNPLLENIWMTIHPPILFIGYALALVPFSYALAALMRKEYTAWLRPALPWTLFSLTFLGAGILLGGAWAYVSLTFGGFWAWDPVENSSLVPWMTLMAALHLMLIARKQHFALLASFLFACLGYVLVLYATYLTRSGVLAETSAHSFGENGMALQLVVYILVFLLLMAVMVAVRFRSIYEKKKELLLSREFWMFMGALIIILAAFQVMFTTSIPVFNKLLGTSYAPPSNSVAFYNRWQTPFALLIAGFLALSQFLNYDRNDPNSFVRKLFIPFFVALGLTVPFVLTGVVTRFNFILFLFFILLAIVSSLANMLFTTSRPRNWGGMITHLGFGLFLLGVLITFSNSETISANTSGIDLGSERSNRENLLLTRGDTLYMSGFYVTYVTNVRTGNFTDYQVDFLKRKKGKYTLQFTLHPTVNVHPTMGAVYNPDTKHFPGRDYYTYIAAVNMDPDYIVIKTISNPYILVLWIGSVIMITGIGVAFVRRLRISRHQPAS